MTLYLRAKDVLKLKTPNVRTPSKRHVQYVRFRYGLNKNIFLKSQVKYIKKKFGKGLTKQIILRFRERGTKKLYRNIENYRISKLHCGIIEQFEYNPTHTALLARVYNPKINYHFYIRASLNLKIGSSIYTNTNPNSRYDIERNGACGTLLNICAGLHLNNINIKNSNGIARSAGCYAVLVQKYLNYCLVRFPSLKIYYVPSSSQATLGRVSNELYNLQVLGKAGANRWKGKRPHVRGVAMNPIDHPHGGGEGKSSGGQSTSVSLWGKPTKQIKKKKFLVYSKNHKDIKSKEKVTIQRKSEKNLIILND